MSDLYSKEEAVHAKRHWLLVLSLAFMKPLTEYLQPETYSFPATVAMIPVGETLRTR